MATISSVILTKNEEKNIARCLESVSWCDEIIVIDDYSEDETVSVISHQLLVISKKIQLFKRHLNRDFSAQRNFGLSKARGEWVLFVDSDEIVSRKLQDEIQKTLQIQAAAKNCKGYLIRRKDYFFGRWLKYGETANVKLLRLAKKDAGRWQGRVHEKWEAKGKIGVLEDPLLHYPHPTLSLFLQKINQYTSLVAQSWKEEGRRVGFCEIILYPAGKFVQNYFLRLGFLDGIPGLIMAILMSFHSFLARSKRWLQQQSSS